jgi:hypothetical protein
MFDESDCLHDQKCLEEVGYEQKLKGTEMAVKRIFGAAESLFVTDTYQFDDYSKNEKGSVHPGNPHGRNYGGKGRRTTAGRWKSGSDRGGQGNIKRLEVGKTCDGDSN